MIPIVGGRRRSRVLVPFPAMTDLLAPTVAPLGTDFRGLCERLHRGRWRAVQLSAAMPGMRPQDLGASARRDVAATLRRLELRPAGLDLWIPREHFREPGLVDRAVHAVEAACGLAADLSIPTLSLHLPEPDEVEPAVIDTMLSSASRAGVILADHADHAAPPAAAAGLDPAASLAIDDDPVAVALGLGQSLVAPRVSDLLTSGFRGALGLPDGRLELPAYRAAVSTVSPSSCVVLDLRQLENPWRALEQGRLAWESAGVG